MLGHALQTALMARFYRRSNPLEVAAARGLSLGITMLPLLYFTPAGVTAEIAKHPWTLLAAALSAALGNWSGGTAFKYMPVGIGSATQLGTMVLSVTLAGYVLFDETIAYGQAAGIGLILLGNMLAVVQSNASGRRLDGQIFRGFLYSVLCGLLLSIGFSLIAKLSRDVNPLAASYWWELTIGIVGALLAICRNRVVRQEITGIDARTFGGILICASPTAVGTGCYALAVTTGPVAVATAILSSLSALAAVLSYFLYGERLTYRQITAIGVVVLAIYVIHLCGN